MPKLVLKWTTPRTRYLTTGSSSDAGCHTGCARIGVEPEVIARLLRLPTLTVEVRAGRAVRKHKLVKSGGLDDLVFQSVQNGHPMNDQNILKRHLQPARKHGPNHGPKRSNKREFQMHANGAKTRQVIEKIWWS